jgi:ribonuclease HI
VKKLLVSEDSRGERPANSGGNAVVHVDMWTDGACLGNPGPGGWAAVLRCGQHQKEVTCNTEQTTNNAAELMAVINGFEALKFPCDVTVYTDSQYVIGVLSLGHKRKANEWLLKFADRVMAGHTVRFVKVKAHSGNPMNELADRLAKAEAERYRSRLA